MVSQFELVIQTSGRQFINVTTHVGELVAQSHSMTGLCNIFLQHTSASLLLCENDDPAVQKDLEAFMQRLIPDGDLLFEHKTEGPDDMPAHIRTVLTQSSLTIPIVKNQLVLGRWQGIYLWEHRLKAFERKMLVTLF